MKINFWYPAKVEFAKQKLGGMQKLEQMVKKIRTNLSKKISKFFEDTPLSYKHQRRDINYAIDNF